MLCWCKQVLAKQSLIQTTSLFAAKGLGKIVLSCFIAFYRVIGLVTNIVFYFTVQEIADMVAQLGLKLPRGREKLGKALREELSRG